MFGWEEFKREALSNRGSEVITHDNTTMTIHVLEIAALFRCSRCVGRPLQIVRRANEELFPQIARAITVGFLLQLKEEVLVCALGCW